MSCKAPFFKFSKLELAVLIEKPAKVVAPIL